MRITVFFVCFATLFSCQTPKRAGELKEIANPQACKSVDLKSYLKNKYKCTNQWFFNNKRELYKPIPRNKVSLVAHPDNPFDNMSKNQVWLEGLEPFKEKDAQAILSDSSKPSDIFKQSPLYNSAIHNLLVDTIRSAKQSIFFDIFLFGGHWGTELSRELIEAAKRDVKVLIIHDTENPFFFRPEIDPVWKTLTTYSRMTNGQNLIAIRPDIHKRPTGIPQAIGEPLKPFLKHQKEKNTSPLLQSDHSKILIIDGLSQSPSMVLGSKNLSDHASGVNFDEVLKVEGPAATFAQLAYLKDIKLALALAISEKKLNPEQKAATKDWVKKLETKLASPKILVQGFSENAEIQLAENNADDSVRNAEMTLLQAISNAKSSVEFYAMGMIPFGIDFVQALFNAKKRGIKVRALLDPRTGGLSGRLLIAQLVRIGAMESRDDPSFRWRRLLDDISADKTSSGMPISQQQHTKTVIIDGTKFILGV